MVKNAVQRRAPSRCGLMGKAPQTWSSPSWSQIFHFAEKRLSHRMPLAVAVVQVRKRPYI